MNFKKRFIIVSLICFYLTSCVIPGSKQELEELALFDGDIVKAVYQVEVASSSKSRKVGLMYRKDLPENQGMLLDYQRSAQMGIWMKNTLISLDIIFIDARGIIVKVYEGAEPLSTQTINSEYEVRAVLEVNAGQIFKHGIKPGDKVRHASFNNQ